MPPASHHYCSMQASLRLRRINSPFIISSGGIIRISTPPSLYAMSNVLQAELDDELIDCSICGDLGGILRLLSQGANPRVSWSMPLREAVKNNHVECVKTLAAHSSSVGSGVALLLAAANGLVDCVQALIPFSKTMADGSQALTEAVTHGHAECAKLLIPVSNMREDGLHALALAAGHGQAECVSLLIRHCDSKADFSYALRMAIANASPECVDILIPVSPPLMADFQPVVSALDRGDAQIFSIMLRHEPRLATKMNLSETQSAARGNGFHDLADLLGSLLDARELSSSTPEVPPELVKTLRL